MKKSFLTFVIAIGTMGIVVLGDGLVNPSLSSVGGSSNGGATNGIQQFNGAGTNTTLSTPTLINPTLDGTFGGTTIIPSGNLTANGSYLTNTEGFNTNSSSIYSVNTNQITLSSFTDAGINGIFKWSIALGVYTNSTGFSMIPDPDNTAWYLVHGTTVLPPGTLGDGTATNVYCETAFPSAEQDASVFPANWYVNVLAYSFYTDIGALPTGNGHFGITTNIAVVNYIQAGPAQAPTYFSNGVSGLFFVSGQGNVIINQDTNFPNCIIGGSQNTNAGFLSIILMSQSCADYGTQDTIEASAACTIFASSGHDGIFASESCIMNNIAGVDTIVGSQVCTNLGNTSCGINSSGLSTIDFGVSYSSILYGENNYLGALTNNTQFGLPSDLNSGMGGNGNTMYGNNSFMLGVNNFASNVLNFICLGQNNNSTKTTNSWTIGNGITNNFNNTGSIGMTNVYLSFSNTTAFFNSGATLFVPTLNSPQGNFNNITMSNGPSAGAVIIEDALGHLSASQTPNLSSVGATTGNFTTLNSSGTTTLNNALITTLTIGPSTNIASFTLVNTNWISGQLYTNQTGRPIMVSGSVVLTTAAVAGFSQIALRYNGVVTNYSTVISAVAGLTGSMTNAISATFIANGGIFTWTNTSSGAGDSSGTYGGQYMVY